MQFEIELVAEPDAYLAEVKRYLVFHHFEVSAPDHLTLIGHAPPRVGGSAADPMHVADEVIVICTPFETGSLRVEGRLNTRAHTRTLLVALGVFAAASLVLLATAASHLMGTQRIGRLFANPNPDNLNVSVILALLVLFTVSLPVIVCALMVSNHVISRRRALALLRVGLRGLADSRPKG